MIEPIAIPGIPEQVTQKQITEALAVLGLDANRVKSLSLPGGRDRRLYVEYYLSIRPLVIGQAEIWIMRGEPVSTSENAAPKPAGNTVTMRLSADGPVKP